jgi:thiol:disulfide interchange protein
VNARTIVGNALVVALFATMLFAFLVHERDKAVSAPLPEEELTTIRLDHALMTARAQRKYLMIEFGADWCDDCRVLAQNLADPTTRQYFERYFNLLQIDIGHSDRNFAAAQRVGLDLSHGIPAIVVFAPNGARIGATNKGELEPSRTYRPHQVFSFLKAIVDRGSITNPSDFQ